MFNLTHGLAGAGVAAILGSVGVSVTATPPEPLTNTTLVRNGTAVDARQTRSAERPVAVAVPSVSPRASLRSRWV